MTAGSWSEEGSLSWYWCPSRPSTLLLPTLVPESLDLWLLVGFVQWGSLAGYGREGVQFEVFIPFAMGSLSLTLLPGSRSEAPGFLSLLLWS